MNVPYNTGKVSIGKYYKKPNYIEQDDDMIAIQGWLIGDNKEAKQRYWANWAYSVTLIVIIALALISYD